MDIVELPNIIGDFKFQMKKYSLMDSDPNLLR
jgi:hypothetical protein